MSLVWTLIATFLYVEIGIVLLFVLPIASPSRWQRFFKSRFLEMINRQAQIYFYLLFGVLVLFLLEAIREMRKYSQAGNNFGNLFLWLVVKLYKKKILLPWKWSDANAEAHPNVGMQHSMRLFRAQRNFYITGFSIFLILVIRRLVMLISSQATLLAQSEASMRQVSIRKKIYFLSVCFHVKDLHFLSSTHRLKVHQQQPVHCYRNRKLKKLKTKRVKKQLKHKNW